MIEGFDVATALRGGVTDRGHAWSFIKAFAASWCAPLTEGAGFTEAEIAAAEGRLRLRFPVALREAYALFGRRSDLIAIQDPLLDPSGLYLEGDGSVLIVRSENQGGWAWGVAAADLASDDPPIALFSDDDQANPGGEPLFDTVALACVETLLSEQVFARPNVGLANSRTPSAELIACVQARYERVELPDYPCSLWPQESVVRWFSAPGQLIYLKQATIGPELVALAQSQAHLEMIYETLPGQWPTVRPRERHGYPHMSRPPNWDPWAVVGGDFPDARDS